MKRIALLLFAAIAGLTATANARVEVSFDFFYDTLAPYGEWANVADYGYVWHPTDVEEDWTPYSDGYWAYTDAGWTWVSYEDWGGITYHYGRWVRVEDYGWCWVPDYEWGPAWVSWRQSDDYVGWAPLPPEARWRRHTGFGIWVDTEYDIGPGCFRFCRVRDFGSPFLRPVLLPCERNVVFIEQTTNITNITYRSDRGHAFNGGPAFAAMALLSARPVPALKLVRSADNVFTRGSRGNVLRNAPQGNALVVAAPPVAASTARTPVAQPAVARSFTAARIDHGWSGAKNDPAHDRIREHFKKQTDGASPQTAPARAFQPGLVAAVPKKADLNAKVAMGAPAAISRGTSPIVVMPGPSPAIVAPAQPATTPITKSGRAIALKPGEPPAAIVPPAIVTDPRGDRRGKNAAKIAGTPTPAQPAIVTPATAPSTTPPAPVIKTLPATPTIIAEPRGERLGKKPSGMIQAPQPAIVAPPTAPKIAPAPPTIPVPQSPPKIAAPPIVQPKEDSAARIAREQAAIAAKKRDAEAAARALEQQRAADIARKQQMALEEKKQQAAAATAAVEKQRHDAAVAESARRNAEALRAAKEQARIAEGQRAAEMQHHQNELNARRAADEGRARQIEVQRQQQAASAAEAARRQAAVQRAPAPIAAPPPQRAPIQLPPPQARPAANPTAAAPVDPRKHKGKDDEKK